MGRRIALYIRLALYILVPIVLLVLLLFRLEHNRISAQRGGVLTDLMNLRFAWMVYEAEHGSLPPATASKGEADWRVGRKIALTCAAITGSGTAFDPRKKWRLQDIPHDLIVVITVSAPGELRVDDVGRWMSESAKKLLMSVPDLRVDDVRAAIEAGCEVPMLQGDRDKAVLFADGKIWFLRPDTPLAQLLKFFTVEDAQKFERDEVLGPYRIDWP